MAYADDFEYWGPNGPFVAGSELPRPLRQHNKRAVVVPTSPSTRRPIALPAVDLDWTSADGPLPVLVKQCLEQVLVTDVIAIIQSYARQQKWLFIDRDSNVIYLLDPTVDVMHTLNESIGKKYPNGIVHIVNVNGRLVAWRRRHPDRDEFCYIQSLQNTSGPSPHSPHEISYGSTLVETSQSHTMVAMDDSIYVFGSHRLHQCRFGYRYSVTTDTWHVLPWLTYGRVQAVGLAYGGKIWAVGGIGKYPRTVEWLDPSHERPGWQPKRYGWEWHNSGIETNAPVYAAAGLHDHLYMVHDDGEATCSRYPIQSQSGGHKPVPMTQPTKSGWMLASGHALGVRMTVIDDRLLLYLPLDAVIKCYDPSTDVWTDLTSGLPLGLDTAAVVI